MLHGHSRAIVFLEDITFLTKGGTLLLQCLHLGLHARHALTVDLNTAGTGQRKRVILKDSPHVMEQSGNAHKYIGR